LLSEPQELEEIKMIRKFCLISTISLLIFALFTLSWAQETKQPDYVREKGKDVKKETRKDEVKQTAKSEKAIELEKLSKQLKEIQAELKEMSDDSDEGTKMKQRMREIRRRITQLKARGDRKPRTKRPAERNPEARVKELRDAIAKDKKRIEELKETNPDSPKLKQLQDGIAEKEKTLERLIAQSRRVRTARATARRAEQKQLKIFQLKNVDVEIAFEIVEPFVKGEKGLIVMVPHTKSLIVRANQNNLRDIETIIKHIDVEAKE